MGMNPVLQTIGKRISFRRRQLRMSQEEMAELCGVHPVTVSCWERDKVRPQRKLVKLCEALQVQLAWLQEGDGAFYPTVADELKIRGLVERLEGFLLGLRKQIKRLKLARRHTLTRQELNDAAYSRSQAAFDNNTRDRIWESLQQIEATVGDLKEFFRSAAYDPPKDTGITLHGRMGYRVTGPRQKRKKRVPLPVP